MKSKKCCRHWAIPPLKFNFHRNLHKSFLTRTLFLWTQQNYNAMSILKNFYPCLPFCKKGKSNWDWVISEFCHVKAWNQLQLPSKSKFQMNFVTGKITMLLPNYQIWKKFPLSPFILFSRYNPSLPVYWILRNFPPSPFIRYILSLPVY